MIIPETKRTLEIPSELEGQEMELSIEVNAMTFHTLSNTLYSDKPLAVLREYSTNASDSHKDNGNGDQPFHVHLPSILDPHLIIRDFGTGISPEKIRKTYLVYFASDKRQNKDANGMFGLGCKAAFAYTDSFFVTSFFAGRKYTYSIFLSENGNPKALLLSDDETTEPSGVEIKMAIRSEDFYSFYNCAQTVYARFNVKPKITGYNLNVENVEHKEKGKGWGLRTGYKSNKGAVAIMGQVEYPIRLADTNLTPIQQSILSAPIDIEFANGELNIMPSREGLSFDTRTIANVQKRLNEIGEELALRIQKEFTSAKNMWEARMLLWKIQRGDYLSFRDIVRHLKHEWNGQKVTLTNVDFADPRLTGFCFTRSYSRGKYQRTELPSDFPTVPDIEFIINDLKKGAWSRCQYLYDQKSMQAVYLLEPKNESVIRKFIRTLGMEGAKFRKASELEAAPVNATKYGATAQGKAKVLRLKNPMNRPSDRHAWQVEDVDLDEPNVYFYIDRYNPTDAFESCWYSDLKMLGFDLSTVPIYGVKNAMRPKMADVEGWTTLKDFVFKKMKELLTGSVYAKTFARVQDYRRLDESQRTFFVTYREALNESLLMIHDAIVEERQFFHANQNVLQYPRLCSRYSIEPEAEEASDITLNLLMAESINQYPMLKLIVQTAAGRSDEAAKNHKDVVLNYLQEIDNKIKKSSK